MEEFAETIEKHCFLGLQKAVAREMIKAAYYNCPTDKLWDIIFTQEDALIKAMEDFIRISHRVKGKELTEECKWAAKQIEEVISCPSCEAIKE